tara:strand:- start:655 stop:807 length:153 start_codon:yes stop_codon:yes gene_type:complete
MTTYTEEEITKAIANSDTLPDILQWDEEWECFVDPDDLVTYHSDINDEPY